MQVWSGEALRGEESIFSAALYLIDTATIALFV
jgi:hypothetical protein